MRNARDRSGINSVSRGDQTGQPVNLEIFSCAGGMSEGFRRAGVIFDMAVDYNADNCDSYEANHGHRPVRMDAVDLLRMVRLGWKVDVDLLVADPPCTPWSRAGKRLGTADERDMLEVTCDLIALLQPRRYLIGNVPGLEDSGNLGTVQRFIGGLSQYGYCVADFASLNAAAYGTPQHRWRPFWFGHLTGPCITWPAPTHGDPVDPTVHSPLPGMGLIPWVTCRQALGHLSEAELGRTVKMKRADARHPVPDAGRPSTTIRGGGDGHSAPQVKVGVIRTSREDSPARTLTTQSRAMGHASTIVLNERHAPATGDAPAPTLGAKQRGQGAKTLILNGMPAKKKRDGSTQGPQSARTIHPDVPATTIHAREDRVGTGSPVLEWPWPRPSTTVTGRPGLPPPGHHDENFAIMSLPDAVILSEKAAAILQGFPEDWIFKGNTKKARWSAIGQATPPQLSQAVGTSIVEQDRKARALQEKEDQREDSLRSPGGDGRARGA